MFEALRVFFGPNRYEPRSWRREAIPAALTAAILVAAGWLIVDAVAGREYPYRPGLLFWGAALLWLGVMRTRAILARQFAARPVGGAGLRALATLSSRATILALTWFPGLAVGWYAIEAENRPSTNSQGVDVCSVSAAQFCVSGPRALIPWAILLLVVAAFATWFYIRSWTGARRRDPEPAIDPREAMLANIRAVFPEARIVEPAPASTEPDNLVDDLARLAAMRDRGDLTADEFEAAKRRLLGGSE